MHEYESELTHESNNKDDEGVLNVFMVNTHDHLHFIKFDVS